MSKSATRMMSMLSDGFWGFTANSERIEELSRKHVNA